MPVTEIESLDQFDTLVAAGEKSARGWYFQALDLRSREQVLGGLDLTGAVFLGCRFTDEDVVRHRGGLIFPELPDLPFRAYRAGLYTAEELYDGLDAGYATTPDARAYAWSRGERRLDKTLAAALHDHAIDDALDEFVAAQATNGRRIVGVMGGHAAERGSAAYADAARLGHALAGRCTVATGGGPGAMEAANLGAALADQPAHTLTAALTELAAVPSFEPDIGSWARAGFAQAPASGTETLGIPTWYYGHEPPNVFATRIAKYFSNSIREDVLLRVSNGGIVFLPGSAGTVQEIFQSGCLNYYAAADEVRPMVLVGHEHWTERLPVWPLLQAQAAASRMRISLVDSIDEVAAALR